MSLNLSANSAAALPTFNAEAKLPEASAADKPDGTGDKSSISLFNKQLNKFSDSSALAESTQSDSESDAIDQLSKIEALLSDFLEQQSAQQADAVEGNEFPLSGIELPALAAQLRQFLNGSGDVSLGKLSTSSLANARLANLQGQLTAISDSLAKFAEGGIKNGESELIALSQTVLESIKNLQRNANFTDALSASLKVTHPMSASGLLTAATSGSTTSLSIERLIAEGAQLGMTESASKDLLITQTGMQAVTGNMRSGALQSAASTSQSTLAQPFNTQLELPLNSAQWGNQVLQRVAWLTGQGISAAEIHLNPAELGPMQVRVDQRQDSATVVFTSHNSSAREAIEASLPRLRELFSEQGMELLDVDINSGEQEANANQQSDFDADTEAEAGGKTQDDMAGGSSVEADNGRSVEGQLETVALHYGLIDTMA
ncbi:MAG: flagellar hook-length control protein FliK [Pseudomonadales bacterium]|nr:flagellar hook-length control protein FliK [Pseudomonadales bacterium]